MENPHLPAQLNRSLLLDDKPIKSRALSNCCQQGRSLAYCLTNTTVDLQVQVGLSCGVC
jgi:hypothetical protein